MKKNHEDCSKLFDQAIYIYLIFCQVKSSFQVKLLSQAFQLNSSS